MNLEFLPWVRLNETFRVISSRRDRMLLVRAQGIPINNRDRESFVFGHFRLSSAEFYDVTSASLLLNQKGEDQRETSAPEPRQGPRTRLGTHTI